MSNRHRRTTLVDVAEAAGVSLATVDRVLNHRPGVSPRTMERVEQSLVRLGYRPDPAAVRLARGIQYQFCFVLPSGTNTFMSLLASQVDRTLMSLAEQQAYGDVLRVDVFDPQGLASTLRGLIGRYHGVATVALDHPVVRDAIDAMVEAGMVVVTLVSDVPNSRRHRYVGIDNSAAGRTVATLMGRFAGQRKGPVGIIAGSLALRDHAERMFGFQQVIASEFPQLQTLPALEGRDDTERCRAGRQEAAGRAAGSGRHLFGRRRQPRHRRDAGSGGPCARRRFHRARTDRLLAQLPDARHHGRHHQPGPGA